MTSHTPGPWKFQQDGNEPYWSVDMPFTDGSGRYGAYNAMVYTTEEDARLVASAPELLEALIAAKGTIEYLLANSDNGPAENCIEIIASAIAKAEGKESE